MRRQSEKQEDLTKLYVDIYNLPEHGNKQDITYFIWKALEKCKALVKHTNPIIKCEPSDNQGYIRLFFRSREQLLNCLDLNGIFYGEKSFYMKSPISMRLFPQINPPNSLNIRRISSRVEDSFNKLYISNLPNSKEFQIINFLVTAGELKSFQSIYTQDKLQHCFFQYQKNDDTESCLNKLNNQKFKDKKVVIKRAALMGNPSSQNLGKSTLNKMKPKSFLFQKDIHSHFLTFDTVGFFKNMKISCIILLKNIIYSQSEKQMIKEDLKREVQKIGPVSKLQIKEKNVYVQYQRVEYAQICYLLLMSRKYDGRSIDISFYDPLNFADGILL